MKKMISPEEALDYVLAHSRPLAPQQKSLAEAAGLTLAEDLVSDRDYPPFDRASMDGYAVRLADHGSAVSVTGAIPAGHISSQMLRDGQAVEIMTGAACPDGTEAVVQHEIVSRTGDLVELPDAITEGKNIARVGSECHQGAVVLKAGEYLAPLGIANAAGFGRAQLSVIPRPSAAIIVTGEELVSVETEDLAPAHIRDSNGPMLAAFCRSAGIEVHSIRRAGDTLDSLLDALNRGADADIIILSGGVSMGARDLVPDAVKQYGAETVFHKVRQKPGKPLLFADKDGQICFGLPGNPLSVHVCFHRYVLPAARKMAGQPPRRIGQRGILASDISIRGTRTVFQLCTLRHDGLHVWLTPCTGAGSADIFSAAAAAAYIRIDPDMPTITRGTGISYWPVGGGEWTT